MSRLVIHNYLPRYKARDGENGSPDKGIYIKFDRGGFIKLASQSDRDVDAAVKKAGLWKKGRLYPSFDIYIDGEWDSGGGGSNSGSMDSIAELIDRVRGGIRESTGDANGEWIHVSRIVYDQVQVDKSYKIGERSFRVIAKEETTGGINGAGVGMGGNPLIKVVWK